jgi:hypothetical protein
MPEDERRRKKLTPMSGELNASADWVTPSPVPEKRRRRRKEKKPPVTPREVLLGGLKRIAIVLAILGALLTGIALLLVHYSGMAASRAFPLTFYAGGAFLALGGFLGASTGPSTDWIPIRGYDYQDKARGMNNSFVYGAFGVALILVGAVLDSKL